MPKGHKPDCKCFVCKRIRQPKKDFPIEFCLCGCGGIVNSKIGSKFLRGHNLRINNPSTREDVRNKHKKNRKGKTLEELGHEPDCKCGPCKNKRGEPFSAQNHPVDCECMCCSSKHRHKPGCLCYICKGEFGGENNPAWKGGVSFFPYPHKFNEYLKEYIRIRDYRCCKLCHKTEQENNRKLDVHHIDYNKQNIEEYNLISLCSSCHKKTNFNREYWENLLSKKNYYLIHAK